MQGSVWGAVRLLPQEREQVIAEFTRISAEHPGAEVRRGNANRWEIWPPATTTEDPSS